MCYSAQIQADYRKYVRMFGAHMSIREFAQLYWERAEGSNVKIPKAMDAAFSVPGTDEERRIKEAIERFNGEQATRLEQELFKQRARLADADRTLQGKTTKAATESKRIATSKIELALRGLDDLRRTELKDRDSRIFPGNYAPVMVMEDGKRVIKPMRYLCRPAGKPAFYDKKYPGIYNARRNNLEGFWKSLFGYSHGIMLVSAFYENVSRARTEGRKLKDGEKDENVVLEFRPQPAGDMLIACLWSHWQSPGQPDLFSFAAITDEPPPEIAAAGHDRCIIPIKPEHIDAWLCPEPNNLAAQYAILDDRHRPYYEHRMAA
ncbi:SOS response-associated peptidase family protein [Paraburkholderia sp. MM5384-R2]|uniref:SOS response-associated peptidase family protein n=1 Tax=Paraburkholderia sp. MM5384-R2 TaxID=2723097 RepID=UPI001607F1C2|nr:SOS response-associated peptidase family protein [Paraburkholderia sp. MM5384-R2]MBB5498641.1 putative SOS response-associated peptidase YedK [Paraburkholderia sp. MM5384-R2]